MLIFEFSWKFNKNHILLKTQLKNTKETIGFHCVLRKEPLKSRKVPFRSEKCKKVARDRGFCNFNGNPRFCALWGTRAQTLGKAALYCCPVGAEARPGLQNPIFTFPDHFSRSRAPFWCQKCSFCYTKQKVAPRNH